MPDYKARLFTRTAHYLCELTFLDAVLLLIALSVAVWLKLFLIVSGPEDLAWMLSPVVHAVRAFTGLQFLFDPAKGYINFENAVVIGTSCAGVNYLVIALCMTVFSFVPRFTEYKLPAFALLVLAAYAVTVTVNAFRIISGIVLLRAANHFSFVITDAVHETAGIFVYFSFLALYYVSLQALLCRVGERKTGERRESRGK